MSITYYDFKELSRETQYGLVMTQGKMISEIRNDKLKFVLYEMPSFSVEIVYHVESERVEGLNIFQNNGMYGK